MTAKDCMTLGEYRREVRRMTQAQVAAKCKVRQGWISQIELGHLPAPWNRDALLAAYGLSDKDFVRMVLNAAKLKSLRTPATESDPLFATAQSEYRILPMYDAQLREAQQALLMRKAAQ